MMRSIRIAGLNRKEAREGRVHIILSPLACFVQETITGVTQVPFRACEPPFARQNRTVRAFSPASLPLSLRRSKYARELRFAGFPRSIALSPARRARSARQSFPRKAHR